MSCNKKIALLFLTFAVAWISCQNKRLDDIPLTDLTRTNVNVRINWQQDQLIPTTEGMRINLFALDGTPHYGKADVNWDGGTVKLTKGTTCRTYAYSYIGNNVQFRNESDPDLIEATSAPLVRATYSRAYPEEPTISGIIGSMYAGENQSYTVLNTPNPQYIEIYPEDVVKTYTFEVRGVKGAQFISAVRGGISGMSASRFLATGQLSATPSTLLFDAAAHVAQGTVTGSFRTFGRLDDENTFVLEILYPSNTSGIMQKTWNVTGQISGVNSDNYHIVIDPAEIEVPDEGGGNASAWQVDLNSWNDVTVPLN